MFQTFRNRPWVRLPAVALLFAAFPSACPLPLAAQEIGNVPAGRKLAETWCSGCHALAANAQNKTDWGAPTFASVARMKSTTALSLRVFLQTPHANMPDLHLSREEIDDLTAFILSLRQP